MNRLSSIILLSLATLSAFGGNEVRRTDRHSACPIVRIVPERLPDLNIARGGHSLFCTGDEVVVVGGHSNGFIPTATAEYYHDGKWYLLNTVYTHDDGMCLVLKSGKVLLTGGLEKELGIGQTFPAEIYDPSSHSFEGFAIMSTKRAEHTGVELDSGRVAISGNWYHGDSLEIFDGMGTFHHVKEMSIQRSYPYMIRYRADDALIFGNRTIKGDSLPNCSVDRVKGEPFEVPLFKTWQPMITFFTGNTPSACFIGDEALGHYESLFPVVDSCGQMAIALVRDTVFSLLPTTSKIPMSFQGKRIMYSGSVIVDKIRQHGYVVGVDCVRRQYILSIEYGIKDEKGNAPLTLYYSDPMMAQIIIPVLTKDGDLMFAGGYFDSNFSPFSSTYLYHLNNQETAAKNNMLLWPWLLTLLAMVSIGIILLTRGHSKPSHELPKEIKKNPSGEYNVLLMQHIREQIEEHQLYRKTDLKVTDIADRLGLHRNQISYCINSQTGGSFSKLINSYRLEYAKRLLSEHPEMKVSAIGMLLGFANETTFFKIFRSVEGVTPNTWRSQHS